MFAISNSIHMTDLSIAAYIIGNFAMNFLNPEVRGHTP